MITITFILLRFFVSLYFSEFIAKVHIFRDLLPYRPFNYHHHHHHYHHEKQHCHSRRLFLHILPSFLYNCSNSSHGKGAKLRPRHVIYNFERYSQRITVITRKHILSLYQDMSLLHNLGAAFFLITLYRDYRVLVC